MHHLVRHAPNDETIDRSGSFLWWRYGGAGRAALGRLLPSCLSLSLSLPQAAVKGTDQPCRPTPARRTPSAALRSESESESARTSPRSSIHPERIRR
jgi:hypothetical protein